MILDKENMYSDGQAITVSGMSTNIIDQGRAADSYKRMFWIVQSKTDFAGGTSVQAVLQVSDTEDFASPINLASSPVVLTADLKAGNPLIKVGVPIGMKRYSRTQYIVDGTMTAGTLDSALVLDVDVPGAQV